MKHLSSLTLRLACAVAIAVGFAGCAKLPIDNEAPETPTLSSTGVRHPGYGVPVTVTAADPDDDRVSVQFRTVSNGIMQDSAWSSWVDSGSTTEFYLDLAVGSYAVLARARDELGEVGDFAEIPLEVTQY